MNVSLAHNRLTTIPSGFLNGCSSVERLDLRGNRLSLLPDTVFAGLPSLRHLQLGDNLLTEIKDGLLAPLERLDTLILARNRLATMSPGSLASNTALAHVDVSDNRLRFPASSFPRATPFSECFGLKTLNLEKNEITSLYDEWRLPLTHLSSLNLRRNNLTRVSYDDLVFTANGVTIDLRDNAISEVDFYSPAALAFLGDGGETTVLLDGNPFNCTCRLYNFVGYVAGWTCGERENAQGKKRIVVTSAGDGSEMRCAGPGLLKNATLAAVPQESLVCNVTHKCPPWCSCVEQPCGRNVSVSPPTNQWIMFVHFPGTHGRFFQQLIVHCPKRVPRQVPWNTTILHLENNTVTSLMDVFNGSTSSPLKEVYLGSNRLSSLDVPDAVPIALSLLDVSSNNLTRVSADQLGKLMNLAPNLHLRLADNPWACDCETRPFFDFVLDKFSRIEDFSAITCAATGQRSVRASMPCSILVCLGDLRSKCISGGFMYKRISSNLSRLSELKPEDLCPEAWRGTVWATSAVGVMLVASLVLAVAYVRYGIHLR